MKSKVYKHNIQHTFDGLLFNAVCNTSYDKSYTLQCVNIFLFRDGIVQRTANLYMHLATSMADSSIMWRDFWNFSGTRRCPYISGGNRKSSTSSRYWQQHVSTSFCVMYDHYILTLSLGSLQRYPEPLWTPATPNESANTWSRSNSVWVGARPGVYISYLLLMHLKYRET